MIRNQLVPVVDVPTSPAVAVKSEPTVKPQNRSRFPVRRLIALTIVLSAGFWIWQRYEQTAAEVITDIYLHGNIDVRQVNLSFKVAGRIDRLLVDEGDTVKAGQPIATLDEVYFRDDLTLAKAQRDQAQANYDRLMNGSRPEEIEQARAAEGEREATLKRTEQDLKRAEAIRGTGAISNQEFDSAMAAMREAQARLKSSRASRVLTEIGPRKEDIASAKAQLAAATAQIVVNERRLTDRTLISPNDGVILTRAREVGAIVNPGETVFTLTLSTPVWVRTYVGEPDLGYVQPGQKVSVSTDAGHRYTGHIGYVSPTAEFTPKSVETRELRTDLVYRLRVVVDNPDGYLRQGMPIVVTIPSQSPQPRKFADRMVEALGLDRLGFKLGAKP